ncbi:hypothetical protein ABPG74_005846 [Tetrahymena malaccensis]
MELENFTYPALNSARSNSDQFDQTDGDSQQFDLSQYNSSNTSFSQTSSYNSYSSPYANNYQQQQQQYHYQMRQYYQYHFNQGMLQYHHVPMQPQVPMFPMQQQPYYPQQQYPQQYNPQAYLYPQSYDQHSYHPQASQRFSSVSSCSSYSSKQQTPEQSGKNVKMEAMRKRLSCVDTGKGGLILKQFGKRNSSGNNIPTFNSNFQPQY